MSIGTGIEWTNATWNPTTGCNKVSPGCKNCYAESMSRRLQAMGQEKYRNGFKLTLQPDVLGLPLKWKKSKRIFVNSMSDLFHKDVPDSYIQKVFFVMRQAKQHQFQVLTKRSERLAELDHKLKWTPHIWQGVSVDNADYACRIDHLRQTGAHVKFLSIEPLLGPIPDLNLKGIDWVIVGGESGRGARPIRAEWAREIRDQCLDAGVPFFFKQWGGVNKAKAGRLLDGKEWNQFPSINGAMM